MDELKKNNNVEEDSAFEIDIMQLIKVALKNIWIPIVCVVLCAAAFFVYYSAFVPKRYTSSTTLYAYNTNSTAASTTSSDLTNSKNLLALYSVIFKSETLLDKVKSDLNLPYSVGAMKGMISVASVDQSPIYRLSVTSTSPEEAKAIADAIVAQTPERTANITDGWELVVVDEAKVPTAKSSPNVGKNTLLGAAVGLVIACCIIFVIYLLDNTVHDEEYFEKKFGLPVLAAIPNLTSHSSSKYGYYKKSE